MAMQGGRTTWVIQKKPQHNTWRNNLQEGQPTVFTAETSYVPVGLTQHKLYILSSNVTQVHHTCRSETPIRHTNTTILTWGRYL